MGGFINYPIISLNVKIVRLPLLLNVFAFLSSTRRTLYDNSSQKEEQVCNCLVVMGTLTHSRNILLQVKVTKLLGICHIYRLYVSHGAPL